MSEARIQSYPRSTPSALPVNICDEDRNIAKDKYLKHMDMALFQSNPKYEPFSPRIPLSDGSHFYILGQTEGPKIGFSVHPIMFT